MKKIFNTYKGPLIILCAAIIWGTTFVAQKLGSDNVGAFTYCGLRFLITGIIMTIFCLIRDHFRKKKNPDYTPFDTTKKSKKWIIMMCIIVGLGLAAGSVLQQIGINYTKSASKSGFITSIYMMIVPIFGLFFHKKVRPLIWVLLVVSLIGSFLISYDGNSFGYEVGDLFTLACAFGFAIQITAIDLVIDYVDGVTLSAIEFMVTGILCFIVMLITEPINLEAIQSAMFAILYAAIFSGCIAYTFQAIGQKYTNPTIAGMLMSLESVFALISGILFLHEDISITAWIGSALMFGSVILSQINFKKKKEEEAKK